ncbi:hypothetical protein [Crocinitomix catalasitica]|uniref:hypothetical protein n=1 Tax=Crocinitomix catalasitica TaxID=184607 RepID=UPI00047F022B|nr:hypothetical protein [Crocinitomix catalasitica]
MKNLKHIAAFIAIGFVAGGITYLLKPYYPIKFIVLFLFIGFFIVNILIRKSLIFKKYFTSQYNFLTSKIESKHTYDIPIDLMFEKAIEVISNSQFKLVDTNKETMEVLAISKISFKSWGENIYLRFEPNGDKSIMYFCSTTLFQSYSWGKNESNNSVLFNEIEASLTV